MTFKRLGQDVLGKAACGAGVRSPEEQEMRNTLKASLVAGPILDPK